jgi:hypothetical protein
LRTRKAAPATVVAVGKHIEHNERIEHIERREAQDAQFVARRA